jgi:hypothetical protein
MTGRRFGRLCAIALDHRSASVHAYCRFACDSGADVISSGHNVRAGRTKSRRCPHCEISAARLTDHGHRAQRRHDATYRAWHSMRREALMTKICGRWAGRSDAFLADMGERPSASILRRLDLDKPYRPGSRAWTMRDTRADRARIGRTSRRTRTDQAPVERAATSQSKSAPWADDIMRASTRL